MESLNGNNIVGLVSRAVAVALAFTATAGISVGTAVILTGGAGPSAKTSIALVFAPVRAFLGV